MGCRPARGYSAGGNGRADQVGQISLSADEVSEGEPGHGVWMWLVSWKGRKTSP